VLFWSLTDAAVTRGPAAPVASIDLRSKFNILYTQMAVYSEDDERVAVACVSHDQQSGYLVLLSNGRNDSQGYQHLGMIRNQQYDYYGDWIAPDVIMTGKIVFNNLLVPTLTLYLYKCDDAKPEPEIDYGRRLRTRRLCSFSLSHDHHGDLDIFARRPLMANCARHCVALSHGETALDCRCATRLVIIVQAVNAEGFSGLNTQLLVRRLKWDESWAGTINQDEDSHWSRSSTRLIISDAIVSPHDDDGNDVSIDVHGVIIATQLTRDHSVLLVNYRPWIAAQASQGSDEEDALDEVWLAAEQVQLRLLDLRTLDWVFMSSAVADPSDWSAMPPMASFCGHKAYTVYPHCFYLWVEVTRSLVASGSEDGAARIWDRYYGGEPLVSLPHSDVVNSVAFLDEGGQRVISVSDDCTIRVWCTRAYYSRRIKSVTAAADVDGVTSS